MSDLSYYVPLLFGIAMMVSFVLSQTVEQKITIIGLVLCYIAVAVGKISEDI